MTTPVAAPAETAATATTEATALPESTSAAASKFVEAKAAKAKETEKPAAPAKVAAEARKPRLDPNLVKREREATDKLQRAEAIEAKFQPLTEALTKRDLTGALNLMAKDHGVTFADFVAVLQSSGDKDESVEKKAERIARETIDKAKADDAKKAADEAAARKVEQDKAFEANLTAFRATCQAEAEKDPARWKQAAVNGTGDKAWDAIWAFNAATGGKLEIPEALDVVEESWDLVNAHFAETKKRLDIKEAIQLVVGELAKLGAEGARVKLKETRTAGAGGNVRNEADGQTNGGRVAVPSLSNRTTSGTGVRPMRDPNAPVRFDKSAVEEAIERAGLTARLQ